MYKKTIVIENKTKKKKKKTKKKNNFSKTFTDKIIWKM